MLYSQCLLSPKSPLAAIRVAAYCFKKLKKVQVNETDICFSVDKILRDEINDQTYRVLAALLLGLVRIYSKKVEYLAYDCNEVLLEIKKFKITTKGKGPMETLCATITMPERFELDAFDLEVSDNVAGGNIAPPEEITLKDVWQNEQIGQFSLDKIELTYTKYITSHDLQSQFEKFSCSLNLSSADNQVVEEDFHQSHQMDISFLIAGPSSPTNLLAGNDTPSPEKQVNLDTDLVVEVLAEPVSMLSPDKQIDEEKTIDGEFYEDEGKNISVERIQPCGISEEEFSVSFQGEVGPMVPLAPFNESHPDVEQQIEAIGNKTHQESEEVRETRNSEGSMEWIRDDHSYQEECTLHNNESSVHKETLKEHIEESNGDSHTKQDLGLTEYISMEGQKFDVIPITSIFIDFSPWFHDASTAKPKQGATTPKDMLISTSASREGACFTRKRKSIIDDVTVLSNEEVKQNIRDASDLVSKRGKSRHTLRKAWKSSHIPNLPKGFHDSLMPCHSLKLKSMFSKNKVKILSQKTKVNISESLQTKNTPRKLEKMESDKVASPKTPPLLSTIQSVQGRNDVTPLSPHESLRREKSLRNDEQLNQMNEENNNSNCSVGTLSLHESLEADKSLRKDEEHSLMNEDSYSLETHNSQFCAWTGQTREVAMDLHRSLLSLRNRKEGEVVNFSQVFGSKTRKQCARLFHEILVLKTTDFVDVKQDDAYGDISIRKLQKWDETFGVDGF